mmetsp:Transcript_21746/g.31491  ORF Transcript_21746/g.31491 Transcript_21746/m.31491 type:complete len:95 (+) Transcript_21746:119-403(+)
MSDNDSASVAELVRDKCTAHFEAHHCAVVDNTDNVCSGYKFELTIVSSQFEKVPLIQRHRKVNTLLKDENIMDSIHAITIKAWTPEQWSAKQKS